MKRRSVWFALVAFAASTTSAVVSAQTPAPPVPPPVDPLPVVAEEPEQGLLQSNPARVHVFAGVDYGSLKGSEIENADPMLGFEGGASFRVMWDLSVWGSYATSSSTIQGQVVQLLDVPVRPDGRSGTVDGQIDLNRFRVGIRVDGLREAGFRVQPYLVGAAIFTSNKVKLDTVDGRAPAANRRSFKDDQIGALGRFGVEAHVTSMIAIDGHLSYEIFELPPATNASAGVGGGISLSF